MSSISPKADNPKAEVRRRPASALATKLSEITQALEERLEDPRDVLETLVSSVAKGEPAEATWELLHRAAARDGKVSELAQEYEQIAHDKRIKLLAPEQQSFIFRQTAEFFSSVYGDVDLAVGYAERAYGVAPDNESAFALLESLLTGTGRLARLARLYLESAERVADVEQKRVLLGRAFGIAGALDDADDLVIEAGRRILDIVPEEVTVRDAVMQRLIAAGRHADVVDLLEKALAREPSPPAEEARLHREQLIDLCFTVLQSPERALTHVEGLLALEPRHEMARKAAEGMLEHKQLMPRAAAALSDAFQAAGELERAVSMLTFELKHVRGPRRVEVQRRLAILRQDVLGDVSGALELLGPVVAGDPGDDALRRRYVALSLALNQPDQAARLLSRALSTHRDPGVRARVGVDVGNVYVRSGDLKRAHTAFSKVLESGADPEASLEAARRMAELFSDTLEPAELARVLETIVRLEPEREPRQAAARRLARLADGELGDAERAIVAWRALVGSPWTDEALSRLDALYRQAGDQLGLSDVLAFRAERTRDPVEARELAVKALELRTAGARDSEASIAAYQSFAERFGPSRELHARLLPLLEQTGRFAEVADVLLREIELVQPSERGPLWARLGQVRLSRLSDARGALEAFSRAFSIDSSDRTARAGLERLLAIESTRIAAADLLEPVYRSSGTPAELLKVLEARAEGESTVEGRLTARDEVIYLAENELGDPDRALEHAVRALRDALENDPSAAPDWSVVVLRLAPSCTSPARRAELLLWAAGSLDVVSQESFELARAAGDAAVAAGDIERGIEVYRRALLFDPSSRELVQRIDELLAQMGAPEERLSLYAAALARESDPARRRELLHALARLQRVELGDRAGATATLRTAVSEDPRDFAAHEALVQVLGEAGDFAAVRAELERVLPLVDAERRPAVLEELARATERAGDAAGALAYYRELLATVEPEDAVLTKIEELALSASDVVTLETVLDRRLGTALEPARRAELLERRGDLAQKGRDDVTLAARLWFEAARLYEGTLGDGASAVRLYSRVLEADATHTEAAERLVELCAEIGDFEKLRAAFDLLVASGGEREVAGTLLKIENRARESGQGELFAALADVALARVTEAARRRSLLLAKARALGAVPEAADTASALFRTLVGEPSSELFAAAAEAFADFLRRAPRTAARIDDLRWLFAVRAERAADPGSVLLEWARAEENELGDAAAAMALYERVVAQDPEQVEAWTELARLQAAAGDAQGAFASLDALSARLDPEARLPVEVTKATLLMDELGRPGEALDLVRPILAQNPSDVSALRIVHRALSVPSTRRDAAELLENAAEAADDAEQRVAVIEALLAVSADDPELSAARGRWLAQLIESKENEPEEALRIALRGAEAAPGEEELWSFAEQMARRLERPEPVAEAYARALARGPEPSVAERLGRRMVEFHEEWFDEPEEVIALLERVLALCPDATWAFERLKLAFNAAGRWQELFALYDRRLALPLERAERLEILREASMAARDFAGDPERAIHYFEALHREAKNDGRVEASLERLYERHGKKRPLIDLLSARLERLDKAERSALRVRIAELWLELGEPEPALALGEALLDENERVEDAVRVLERILELPRARDAAEDGGPSALRRATAHLERHYESVGQVVDLVRVLGIQHSVAESREERRELLERIVNLRLRDLDDTEGAFDAVSELVLLDPGNLTYRKQLGELSRRIGADARRVEVLIAAQDAEVPVDVRAALLNEAAQVRRYSLAEAEGASALYRKVLGLAEAPPPAQLEAARALSELLRAGGAAEERVNVLERLADLETDAAARRAALGEAAELAFEALGDAPRAIAAYRLRLADDAKDLEAMDGLCRALEAIARWDELIEALEARAAIVPEADARRDRVRIARLHADVKEDRAAAIVAFRRVAELYGSDRETFTALSDLLAQERRWDELAELLVEEIERETERERQRHLELELGALHEQRTGKRLAALEAYVAGEDWQSAIRVAGAAHTDGETGRRVCARLLELSTSVWLGSKAGPETEPARAADWAITELGARLLEDGRYADVVERLLAGSELPFPERRRRELRREAACLTADRLGDAERAIELFQALLAEDPADEVARGSVTRLALLLEEQERFEELVELWKTQAEARSRLGDVAGAQVLWARAGELAETRLGDRERALAAYSAGAELGGEACLEALARVYSESGELDLAARALERLCAQSTGDALGERALELAEIYVSLGRAARAREALEQSLPKVVEGAKLRARLAGLYREAHDWLALALLLEDEANRAVDPKAKLALLWEAAELHLDRRSEPEPAIALLERAVELSPEEARLRLRLAQACIACRRYEDAARVLREQLSLYGSRRPKDRALVHYELARALLEAGDRAVALAELEQASKIDPAHPIILSMLARTAFEEGDLDRAERMYRALLLVEGRDGARTSRAEALLSLGDIAERRGDAVRAEEFVESAFEAAQESADEAVMLERALRARGRPELLARAIGISMGHGPSAPEATRSLLHLCELYAELGKLDDNRDEIARRAAAAHQELERLESVDDGAWAALGRVYELLGDAAAEAAVLERRVQSVLHSSRPPADPDLLLRLARARLSDPATFEEGLGLLERALDAGVSSPRIKELVELAFTAHAELPRPARLLERVARAAGDDALLAQALLERIELGEAAIEDVRAVVEIAARLDDAALARRVLERALEDGRFDAVPADAAWLRRELAQRMRAAGDRARARALEEAAVDYLDADAARALLVELSREAEGEGDFESAVRVLEKLHREGPADPGIFRPLLALQRKLGNAERLVELIEQIAPALEDATERLNLRLEQAEVLLSELRRTDEAILVLRDVVREAPGHAAAVARLAELLEREGRKDELIELFEIQMDAAKDRGDAAAIAAHAERLAELLEQRGRPEAAMDACRAALEWQPPAPRPLLGLLARLSEAAGDQGALAEALEALLAIEEGDAVPPLARRLAKVRDQAGDTAGAERALETGFVACPSDPELCELLVRRYEERGETERVAGVLARALEARPDDLALLERVIDAERAMGRPERALSAIDRLLERREADAAVLRRRASVCAELGEHARAVQDLERALAQDPSVLPDLVAALERAMAASSAAESATFALRLVELLEASGDLTAARERLAERVQAAPDDRTLLARLAALDVRLENWEQAASEYAALAALEQGPELVGTALTLWDLCQRIGRPADARSALERALAADPTNVELKDKLGELLEAMGAYRERAELLVREAEHTADAAERLAKRVRAAELFLLPDGDAEAAVRVLEAALEDAPLSPDVAVLLARAHTQLSHFEQALTVLNAIVEANRGKRSRTLALVFEEMADVHLAEGYLSDALQALQRAFEMDSRNARLGMRLARLALESEEEELAQRALRAISIMKTAAEDGPEGARPETKADANVALAWMARKAGDPRRARVLVTKALAECPEHAQARALLAELDAR